MSISKLLGEIESPRPLHAVGGRISIAGWCVTAGQKTAPDVRVVIAERTYPVSSRRSRADVAALLPTESAALSSGFIIDCDPPAGVHLAHFEAEISAGEWAVFKRLSLSVESKPFIAAVDTPISAGVLRDRVKVGGWALEATQPIAQLSFRYGHRDIACVLDQPRDDVAAAFKDVAHASRSGFVSDDFLVAGHGAVRVRATLANGQVRIASTPVTFSVAEDENHGPELDLTATRVGLDSPRAPRATSAPIHTRRALNIVFILPGSFAANSALHVAALANELSAAGHDCAVAVARDAIETLAHLDRPAFRALTHAEAESPTAFLDRGGPDIVHAWTTSENVRALAEKIKSRHGCGLVAHLEDNEQQILALSSGYSIEQLRTLPELELGKVLRPTLSHPRRSREFLERCDGVTVIMDRLREFVPTSKSCVTLSPAMDARWFYPRPIPAAFRQALQLRAGTTVVFYHGNVHASNAAEVRELYRAILELNRAGDPVTLIRTGRDQVDFLGELAAQIAPFVVSLGVITQHHHLPPLMALADIFVQPGWADPFNDYRFPSKLPEFFALGRPVVLPRANLGVDLRHGIDAYVLDRADAAGIAKAVRELRASPELSAQLSRGAVDYAAKHFSWSRSAATLASFYQTLASS